MRQERLMESLSHIPIVTSVNASPAETLTRWQLLRDAWQSRLQATSDEGDRLLLLCGLSVADRMIWQLQRGAEATACQSR
jgi:cytochrome oxidase assembly protein ShyY1